MTGSPAHLRIWLADFTSGRLPLASSFWIGFLPARLLVLVGQPLTLPPLISDAELAMALTLGYIALFHLLLLPWQCLGLWRASESYLARLGPLPWLWAVYGAVFASLIFSLVSAGTAVQTLVLAPQGPGMAEQLARERQSRYRFTASADGQTLRLEGTFELAITRNFTTFLARYPGAQQLILESPGGNIHEARGIASLVRERSLETRVEGSCHMAVAW